MATVTGPRDPQTWANEGHVADIMLLGAIASAFAGSAESLTAQQIAAALLAEGYPAASAELLQTDVQTTLRRHPEAFSRGGSGWRHRT